MSHVKEDAFGSLKLGHIRIVYEHNQHSVTQLYTTLQLLLALTVG
jgi:hypothetical protein